MNNFFLTIWHYIWPVSPIKILLTVFSLFALSRALLRFRAKLMNQNEIVFWTIVWLGVIVVVFVPGKTTALAKLLGMGRGFDAMIFLAIVALLYAVYRLYIKSNEQEKEITKLVRALALKNIKMNKSKPQKSK